MAELRELQRKLDSTESLREIVNAMRNLAAIYVRRAEGTVEAIRPYGETVQTALHVALDRLGAGGLRAREGRTVALVFGSDQGLCGAYNERIVRAAVEFTETRGGTVDVIAVGQRGSNILSLRGVEPILTAPAPTSLEGIESQVAELAADAFEAYSRVRGSEMFFIYSAYEGMGRFRENVRSVLPPRREQLERPPEGRFRYEPILTAPPADLVVRLSEEYFFIELYRALLESHASENGARLASMTAASSNIEENLTELRKDYQSARQDAITQELLDVVGGAEAQRL